MNNTTPQSVIRNEDGAAYSLSVVMITPIYALMMCLIVESALMLVAKVGTVYSAYAAARSAAVWCSATDDQSVVSRKMETAAFRSFTPFASGTQSGPGDLRHVGAATAHAARTAAYRTVAGHESPMPLTVLGKKHANARAFLTVQLEDFPAEANSELKVSVTYRFRFNVPGIGRLLGQRDLTDGRYYVPVRTSVTLHNEGPRNDNQEIGIGYGKRQ